MYAMLETEPTSSILFAAARKLLTDVTPLANGDLDERSRGQPSGQRRVLLIQL
jgi:hypothetical protein